MRRLNIKSIFLFCVALILLAPFTICILQFTETTTVSAQERRRLAQLPEFESSPNYAKKLEAWFNDNFGLRETFIFTNSWIKTEVFKTSMNPEKVMLGKNGWMFYNSSGGSDYIFNSYTHRNLMNETELKSFAELLKKRIHYCDSAGIVYIKGYYPQAQTVYPEMLPWQMKFQIKDTISRADQMLRYIKKTGLEINFYDFKPLLLEEKQRHQVYRKMDTHWNDYAAFITYREIFKRSFDQIHVRPRDFTEFKIEWKQTKEGGLSDMMGGGNNFQELIPVFTPVPPIAEYTFEWSPDVLGEQGYPDDTWVTTCGKCSDKRLLLVFKDSYSQALIPFFSRHFKKVIYLQWGYNQEYVNKYKPDIIIESPVERYLVN